MVIIAWHPLPIGALSPTYVVPFAFDDTCPSLLFPCLASSPSRLTSFGKPSPTPRYQYPLPQISCKKPSSSPPHWQTLVCPPVPICVFICACFKCPDNSCPCLLAFPDYSFQMNSLPLSSMNSPCCLSAASPFSLFEGISWLNLIRLSKWMNLDTQQSVMNGY